jgi:hypothetical protein
MTGIELLRKLEELISRNPECTYLPVYLGTEFSKVDTEATEVGVAWAYIEEHRSIKAIIVR